MDKNLINPRLAYLDNLKALLIIFVVTVHAAITYSGINSWYYEEPHSLGDASYYFFLFYETINQAYFMSLFFMISAYFVPRSLEKKGVKNFITDKLYRLGIPLLIFVFLIHPVCLKMVYPRINLTKCFFRGDFFSWTGPLWFVLALLVFTLLYVSIKKWLDPLVNKYSFDVNIKNALILVLLITFAAFTIRLVFPMGTSVMNMQLCFFSAYVFMFLIGIIAYQKNIFTKIDYTTAKKWLLAAFVVGIPLWIVIIYFGVTRSIPISDWAISGGWNFMSFAFSFWESFFCVAIIIALIGIFKARFNTQNNLQKMLSDNAFGVYVFHTPILIVISLLLKNIGEPSILKFAIVACLAVIASFLFSHFIRKISLVRKIFS